MQDCGGIGGKMIYNFIFYHQLRKEKMGGGAKVLMGIFNLLLLALFGGISSTHHYSMITIAKNAHISTDSQNRQYHKPMINLNLISLISLSIRCITHPSSSPSITITKSWRLQFYWHIMSKVQSKSLVMTSKNYHRGTLSPVRPKEKMSALDFNYKTKQDPLWGKDQSYFRRKLNEGLEYEKQFVSRKGMAESVYNNPECAYTLNRSDFYRRERYQSAKKESTVTQRRFDVLNNQKPFFQGRNEDKYLTSMKGQNWSSSGSGSPFRKTLTHLMRFQPEITAKIGATSNRDYTIPRPQLKVGKSDFIDTYSPF